MIGMDFLESAHVLMNIIKMLICLFLAILFLQSGIDKVINWTGELKWHREHFSGSSVKKLVYPMLFVLTILEITSGLLCIAAIGLLAINGKSQLACWGSGLSAFTIICLFFGQRMAKDYAGAQRLVSYFILALLGMILCVY